MSEGTLWYSDADYRRWLSIFVVLTAIALASLALSISDADVHPVAFAYGVSWFITLVASASTQQIRTRPDSRDIRLARFERGGRIYVWLGVGILKWILVHSPIGWLNANIRLRSVRSGLDQLLAEVRYAQAAHFLGGSITLLVGIERCVAGHRGVGFSFVVFAVLIHAYPVMLMRFHLARLTEIRRRGRLTNSMIRPPESE